MKNKKMVIKKEEYAQVTLRMPVALKERLRTEAAKRGLSLNGYLTTIVVFNAGMPGGGKACYRENNPA